MPFDVVISASDIPARMNAVVATFDDGAVAGTAAKTLNDAARDDESKTRYRVVKRAEIPWREREQARFADGTYMRLPWDNSESLWFVLSPLYKLHCAHVSTSKDGMVAFTESEEKGAADRQKRMRCREYLETFYTRGGTGAPDGAPDYLTPQGARLWSEKFEAEHNVRELLLADTADKIQWVYTHGPESCMSGEPSDYMSECHPTRVYAAGDLAIGYLLDKDGAESVAARCLVWPEKKIRTRIYGRTSSDTEALRRALERAGYSKDDGEGLVGARLLRMPQGNGFIMPYVDYARGARDCGKYLELSLTGDISCGRTDGLSRDPDEPECHCDNCGGEMSADEGYCVQGETWCGDCYENHTYPCDSCAENIPDSEPPRTVYSQYDRRRVARTLCPNCAERDEITECHVCDNYWHDDDMVSSTDDELVCPECVGTLPRSPGCDRVITEGSNPCECRACARAREADKNLETLPPHPEPPTQAELEAAGQLRLGEAIDGDAALFPEQPRRVA